MPINKDKWQSSFERQLDIAEKKQIAIVKRFYKREYNKGIKSFIADGQTNFQLLFDNKDLLKIYRDLYTEIGMRFAKWYVNNFQKFITKAVDTSAVDDIWRDSFGSYGSAVGAQRVTLVSGTAKKNLIGITQRLMRDPEFMTLGAVERGRILRNQFNRYSQYQSERLVRTEATAAANFATTQAAQTIFPPEQMQKEWIASFDDRTRDTHSEADGQIVMANNTFLVGGQQMMFPGDTAGGAAEVINCRCSVAYFPIQGAQTVGQIENINFGLGGGTQTGFGLSDVIPFVNALTIKEAEEFLIKNNIAKKVNYKGLSINEANLINETLFNNYLSINKKFDFDSLDYIKTVRNKKYMFRATNGLEINLDQIRLNIKELNSNTNIIRLENKIKRKLRNLNNYSLDEQKTILKNIDLWKKEIEELKNIKLFYGENLSEFITHEFGHFVENRILRNKNNFNLINDFADSKFRNLNGISFEDTLQSKLDFISYKKGVKISEYATKNSLEYIAEAWVAFMKNDFSVIDNNLLKIFKKLKNGY